MLKKILIGVAAVIVALAVVIALQPSTFHIERSTSVSAPPSIVFAQVNDFHAWQAWSPWEKLDPNMKRSFEGPASGVGAKYAWVGNDDVGKGSMTIQQSDAPSRVAIQIEFIEPIAATNTATFTFTPAGATTKVTWAMDGKNDFAGKAFDLFMSMDKVVGADFERGLAALKSVAESAPKGDTQAAK